MLAAIEYHQNEEHRIMLISGTFTPLLDKLTIHIGVDGSIGTQLEINNGQYTGKIISPINIGRGKVERLNRFLDKPEGDIDLTKSYFYTDSYIDAPVMEMFGHPMAVYPDSELASLAAARGWITIGEIHS